MAITAVNLMVKEITAVLPQTAFDPRAPADQRRLVKSSLPASGHHTFSSRFKPHICFEASSLCRIGSCSTYFTYTISLVSKLRVVSRFWRWQRNKKLRRITNKHATINLPIIHSIWRKKVKGKPHWIHCLQSDMTRSRLLTWCAFAGINFLIILLERCSLRCCRVQDVYHSARSDDGDLPFPCLGCRYQGRPWWKTMGSVPWNV